MPNIEGFSGTVLPGTYSTVETLSRGASIPGGIRVTSIIGQGAKPETIVASANGGGKDGLDPTYTTTSGSDGRHFALTQAPIISNRTSLFRNGLPLVGTEGTITSTSTFSNAFDYLLDTTTGHILLQSAHLLDQGGSFYTSAATNVGLGTINSLTLVDVDAPSETWTVKCINVQRDSLNNPIAGTAQFVATGTVSGAKLDANGNPVIWIANGVTVSNGILQFNITETKVGSVTTSPFHQGDSFTVIVKSGVLNKNDTLTGTYIPVGNLNVPTFFASMRDISGAFGVASTDNNLTLGCQLAFANGAPGIMCVQAAPPLPRRTSYILTDNVHATSTDCDDFIFPLPLGVVPDVNSQVHFFITNPVTHVETQILPNKFPFFTLDTAGQPTTCPEFILSDTAPPGGFSFDYSVNEAAAADVSGLDGYIDPIAGQPTHGIFSSPSVVFDLSFIGKTLKVIDAFNVANVGSFTIDTVANGQLFFHTTGFANFTSQTGVTFELTDYFGNVVAGSAGTDGNLTNTGSATATFSSVAINFNNFQPLSNLLLKISGSTSNDGSYLITNYNNGLNTLTIEKTFVAEHNLRYEIIDPANMSAYIVINHNVVPNGYGLRVTIVDERDASFFDAGWLNALASLETVEIDILVPLPNQTITVIFGNALNHCLTMSNIVNRKERVLFIGAINGLTPDNLTGAKLAAVEDIGVLEGIQGATVADILAGNTEDLANYSVSAAYGETFRVVFFFPDQIVVQAGTQNVLIDGFYIAAAAGGFLSGLNNLAMPLTNKVLTGFTILRNRQFSPLVLQQLAAAGVTVLQPVVGGGNVVWGITTTQSGFVEEQEISIVFIRDRIAKSLRSGFNGFIGQPADDLIVAKLNGRALAILNGFISQGLITAFADLQVVQDSIDPTQYDITVRVQPVFPVNVIFIKVSIGLL